MKIMRIIRIDILMIAKAKIGILLYKDFLVSHSALLEEKQWIYVGGVDVSWFHGTFNAISICLVYFESLFVLLFDVFFFISRKFVQRRTRRFWAKIVEVKTYVAQNSLSWFWWSVGVNRFEKIMVGEGRWGILTSCGTTKAHDGTW